MNTPPSDSDALLADLRSFGPPLFVPATFWWVAAIDHTAGLADGVLVVGGTGELEVRTVSLSRGRTPISIRVRNVQAARVNSPDREIQSGWHRVIVEEADCDIDIAGTPWSVRVLHTDSCFSFELVVEDRIISVSGDLEVLETLRIDRLEELSLTSG